MKNLIFLSLIFLSIFSCAPKNYDKPKDLINQSEMIDILTDLYISQQGIQMFPTQHQDQSIDLAKDAVDIMKSYDITFACQCAQVDKTFFSMIGPRRVIQEHTHS